jgi:hypothetical protein
MKLLCGVSFYAVPLAAVLVAIMAPVGARAADCPKTLEQAGRISMVDVNGQTSTVEALDSGYVRRIEELPQAGAPSKTHIEAYQGFFAETITTISAQPVFTQYYKLLPEAYTRLRAFLPPKSGTVLTLDYDVLYATSATLAAGPVPPSRRWKVTFTVTGEDTVTIGDCRYPVRLIQTTSSNADSSFITETSYAYSPDLKAWLKLRGVFKPVGKPETTIDRTVVSIATLAKD